MSDTASHQEKKTSVFIVIPARFASTRLPGKPLLKIGTKSMIEHVIERAKFLVTKLSTRASIAGIHLIVATDHMDIFNEAKNAGALPLMTQSSLRNGSERVYSALELLKHDLPISAHDLIVNVQGDEPFFSVEDVKNLVLSMLIKEEYPLGTLALARNEAHLFFSSSVTKVVRDDHKSALYFSRAPIPYPTEQLGATGNSWMTKGTEFLQLSENESLEIPFLHHVGVYVFRYEALVKFATEIPFGTLERRESLEQLRALEAGWKILVCDAHEEPFGIDTPEDLKKAQKRV